MSWALDPVKIHAHQLWWFDAWWTFSEPNPASTFHIDIVCNFTQKIFWTKTKPFVCSGRLVGRTSLERNYASLPFRRSTSPLLQWCKHSALGQKGNLFKSFCPTENGHPTRQPRRTSKHLELNRNPTIIKCNLWILPE